MPERPRGSAAFLDRDGTLIADEHYLSDAARVNVLPGVAAAIRMLSAAGYPAIVCTNQSGIARGLITLPQYHAVRRRLGDLLAAEDATLLDTFTCPHHPDHGGRCECRKPGTALFERAAEVHDLDLSRCLFVGDKARDVLPAVHYGARGVLVPGPDTPAQDMEAVAAAGFLVMDTFAEAVASLLRTAR